MSIAFEDQCCLGRKGAVVGHCGFDGHLGLWMVVLRRAGLMAGKGNPSTVSTCVSVGTEVLAQEGIASVESERKTKLN